MGENRKRPDLGVLAIDVTHLAPFLTDLPPGGRQGLRGTLEGFPEVMHEIVSNQPSFGERAGVSTKDFDELRAAQEQMALIDEQLPAARKLVEILEESRAVVDDRLQRFISAIAQMVEARSKAFGDTEILGRYEHTRAYRSAVGVKAAKTRRRNEEAELEEPIDDIEGELPPAGETPPVQDPA